MKRREQLKKWAFNMESQLAQAGEIPAVIAGRIRNTGILSFFILLLGLLFSKELGIRFLFMSLALGLTGLFFSGRLLWHALLKAYVVLEGRVMHIRSVPGFGRYCRVRIKTVQGEETELLLERQTKLQMGRAYRFYFGRREQFSIFGHEGNGVYICNGAFYGMEEV